MTVLTRKLTADVTLRDVLQGDGTVASQLHAPWITGTVKAGMVTMSCRATRHTAGTKIDRCAHVINVDRTFSVKEVFKKHMFVDDEMAFAMPVGKVLTAPLALRMSGKGYLYVDMAQFHWDTLAIGVISAHEPIINMSLLLRLYCESFLDTHDYLECRDCSGAVNWPGWWTEWISPDDNKPVLPKHTRAEVGWCFLASERCPACYIAEIQQQVAMEALRGI